VEITEIRVTLRNEEKLKAFVTVTFDKCFAVRNMKIVEGEKGPMLCMPSRKLPDGTFKDVAHPINADFRSYLEKRIFAAYEDERRKNPTAPSAVGMSAGHASVSS
jgi:stage V sporulation protein G